MMNVIHEFPGVYDEDMNKELYLLEKEEITEAQYNAIKEGYGVTGPDFQIIKDGEKYFLKGDMEIEAVKAVVDSCLIDAGAEPVFETESDDSDDSELVEGE